jgi:hypothetical protein
MKRLDCKLVLFEFFGFRGDLVLGEAIVSKIAYNGVDR